jgi:hypothetical protein
MLGIEPGLPARLARSLLAEPTADIGYDNFVWTCVMLNPTYHVWTQAFHYALRNNPEERSSHLRAVLLFIMTCYIHEVNVYMEGRVRPSARVFKHSNIGQFRKPLVVGWTGGLQNTVNIFGRISVL